MSLKTLAGISLSHRGRRDARRARREEGEYMDVFNRRATPPAGMDRRPDAAVISARALRARTNRRQSHRALIAIAVKQIIGRRTFLCQASDISTEGIFMAKVSEDLPSNKIKCRLEFNLPGSSVLITARGRVVRGEKNGRYQLNAIEFSALAPSHRRMIHQYIESPFQIPPQTPTFIPRRPGRG
jgi:hypothetical protein